MKNRELINTVEEFQTVPPVVEFNAYVKMMEQDPERYAEKFLKKPLVSEFLPARSRFDGLLDRILGIA